MNVRVRRWRDAKGRAHKAFVMDYTDPATGRRRQRVVPGNPADLAEARDLAATIHKIAKRAHHYGDPAAPGLTLAALFAAHGARPGIAPATRSFEAGHGAAVLRVMGDDILAGGIRQLDVDRFAAARGAERRDRHGDGPVGAATILKEIALLNRALKWAATRGLTAPVVLRAPNLPVAAYRARCLTRGEMDGLLAACHDPDDRWRRDPWLRDVVEFLYLTGLRRSELFRLAWPDVDLPGQRIWVATHKRGGAADVRREPVFLAPAAVAILARRQAAGEPGTVFGGTGGIRDFQKSLTRAARAAGLASPETVTPHTFRHTCASHLLDSAATVPQAAAHLRHRDGGALLLRTYAHAHEAGIRGALAGLSPAAATPTQHDPAAPAGNTSQQ